MGHDISAVMAQDGDAEKDDVASHGVGEDVAVVEVDDGVEQAAGGGQEHGVGERVDAEGGVGGGMVDRWIVREYREMRG